MNVKTWIPLILAVVLGLVALVVARKVLRPSGPAAPKNTASVVVAKRDVAVGNELTPADLSVDKVPADRVPARSFGNAEELAGRVVTTTLIKGQLVLDTLLAPAGSAAGVSSLVAPGMRAITIEINEFSGVGGMLLPNSRVDVITTVRDNKSDQQVSRTILQNIRVLATGRNLSPAPAAEGQPVPPPTNNVTLLVTPKQAQTLQLASQGGRPWLVLRSLRDGDDSKVDGTTMAEIRGEVGGDADPFGPGGQQAGTTVMLNGRPTTGPSTQPSAPAQARTWVMRVVRGGVPTEVSFPIEPSLEIAPEPAAPETTANPTPVPAEIVPTSPQPAPRTAPEQAVNRGSDETVKPEMVVPEDDSVTRSEDQPAVPTDPATDESTPVIPEGTAQADRPADEATPSQPQSPTDDDAVTGTGEELKLK